MAVADESRYCLRGLTDDGSWSVIGLPCGHLSACKADAERFLHHYTRIEIIDRVTNAVVHQATRKPIR